MTWVLSARTDGPGRRRGRPAPWNPRQRFRGRGREPGRRVSSGAKRRASHDDRKETDRPQPPVSDEGGDRRQAGHDCAGERSVRVFMRSRSRLRISPRTGASERSEVAPEAGNGLKKPEGLGSQREASVCRRPGAPNRSGRVERPRLFAVAEPAATPEDRQSERSEVCRDRAKEKYKMPEGRACRRAAVVRPAPEAGREPLWGGRARVPSSRRGGAQPGPDGRWHPRGRAGENGAAGGAPSRPGATPRRDPGDCNAGRQPNRSVKRWSGNHRAGDIRACGLEIKHRARISKGGAGPWGRGKGRQPPLPERGRENAGAVTGLEQRNALARPLLPPDGVVGGNPPRG